MTTQIVYSENYLRIPINVHFNKKTKKFFAASTIIASPSEEYSSPFEAIERIKNEIDNLARKVPISWEVLAEKIEDTLVWEDNETCHVDAEILRRLVEQFLQYRQED